MKSLTSKFASSRGWALFLILFLGAGLFVAACGDEDVPTPTTPAPTPPAPPPAPAPEPEPEPTPEPPAVPVGLSISASGVDFIEWSWSAVEGVSGYDVQYSANEAFTDEDEEIARTAEQISYRRENLEAETNHYLRVRSAAGTGDGRVTSGWSTHVTGMTPAATPPPPVVPATPANLKVSETGEDFIEWTWDRVAGAAGYIAQFSTDSRFGAGDPEFRVEGVANTKHKVPNLKADSDGYLRVRAYVGAAAEPTLGDWTEGAKGTTEEAAAPVTTALSAPTGLRTGSATTTTVTLTWSSVDDADNYDVDQRPADGSWTGASCDGGDSQVNNEECEASGLTRGSDYSFRVRANPDPDDETLEQSAWSSSTSARTSGSTPSTPITGGDAYEITWEAETDPNHSITWTWSRPDDGRIRFLYTMIDAGENEREACPAIGSDWEGHSSGGLPQYSYTTIVGADAASLEAGHVVRLCVVPTWKDDNAQRYGDVFSAWAATAPMTNAAVGDIALGPKVNSDQQKTTAIDWYVQVDQGFTYVVQTISATVGERLPQCGSGSGRSDLTSNDDDDIQRFRLDTGLQTYTTYAACVRATNDDGESAWTKLSDDSGEYSTLPGAPNTASYVGRRNDTSSALAAGDVNWRFGLGARLPEESGRYTATVLMWNKLNAADAATRAFVAAVKPDQSVCSSPSDSYMALATGAIREEGGSFLVTVAGLPVRNPQVLVSQSRTIYACVRASLPLTGVNVGGAVPHDGKDGPWSVGSTTVTLKVPE